MWLQNDSHVVFVLWNIQTSFGRCQSFEVKKKKKLTKKNFCHDAIVERGELKATVFAIVEVPDRPSFPGNTDRSWFLRVLFSYFLFYYEGLSSCVMFCFSLVFHLSAPFPHRVLHLLFVFYFFILLLGLCIFDFTFQCRHQLFVFTCLPLHVLCLDPF